ncbi:type IV toxin-antitoxin system AbiEi family antitoxin domain-containing protein [soil metagenome]
MDPVALVRSMGGIASGAALRAAGIGQDRLDRAVRSGALRRVRRGWFATLDADAECVDATAAGGTLSCVSALRQYGVWLLPFDGLHIRVDPGHHGSRSSSSRLHWLTAIDAPSRGRDSVSTALDIAIQCLENEAAIVAIDSALEKGLVTRAELQTRFAGRRRHADLLRRADGTSQAGIETLVKVRLRSHGMRVRTQVAIPGVGRVDLLVGDRLIIETDGRMFHDDAISFSRDRRRDLAAQVRGYLVVRLSYQQIMAEWPLVEAQLLRLIRRDEHLWSTRHRRAADLSGPPGPGA